MPLTDRQAKTAKPDATRPYKLGDSGGLFLLVNPNGSKLWRLKYRFQGKEKLLSFGRYPDLTLQNARKARDEARSDLANGDDPAELRKAAKDYAQRKSEHTFSALAASYLSKQRVEGRAKSTLIKNQWLLNMAVRDFGTQVIENVKAPLILKTLRTVEARGTIETANRLRSIIGTVMRYGMACGWIDADPTPALRGAVLRPIRKNRAAIIDSKKLGGLLRAIEEFEGQRTTQIALRLLALLYPRPGELRFATWGEFNFNDKIWSIPANRTKMRRLHRVPLPSAAIDQLSELHDLTGNYELILPSLRSWKTPMSDNTLNAALRRMGYAKDEMTAHGFRATFSTMANESKLWHPDAIERALAHVEGNEIRRAYDRSDHWEERVRMAEWWANRLACFKSGLL